eukprot:TRINITY_DN3454_c1_g1_i1.p1 TRINITY_DN3454_c1_g1~~TRINITY_DN3454_c1_g1_i1.p1  ORF type:complete len:614 (+),score=107.88 TRINITY_DN3454_c1_g1_i1:87-1928(+)
MFIASRTALLITLSLSPSPALASEEPPLAALTLDDECSQGEQCSLSALQTRGRKLSASASGKAEEAERKKQSPMLCMYYPWLPQCQGPPQQPQQPQYQPQPQYQYQPRQQYQPAPQPQYQPRQPADPCVWYPWSPSCMRRSENPNVPAWQRYKEPEPVAKVPTGSAAAESRFQHPKSIYNRKITPPLQIRARGGLAPPRTALQYKGVAWETMHIRGKKEMHIFAVGDWGSLFGSGFKPNIQYAGGATPAVHTMARFRGPCKTPQMVDCFAGKACPAYCHYTPDVDWQAQLRVADQMKQRAQTSKPDYVLNVGDNFYWGGVNTMCGHPMNSIAETTKQQFDGIFESVYTGPDLGHIPWFNVLGNHDWGGFQFNKGWDQQIAYTWASDRWRMPAPFWMQRVEYDDMDFSAEFFMLDSNAMDSKPGNADPNHNICSSQHNPPGANCAANGGAASVKACFKFMWDLWREQQKWMEGKLQASTADWQVAVTHFNCGHQAQWYKKLYQQYGLDLLVTGHTHVQAVFYESKMLGGLTCFITGGGGGITSEGDPSSQRSSQYGFFDLAISKDEIVVESINYNGITLFKRPVKKKDRAASFVEEDEEDVIAEYQKAFNNTKI